MDSEDQGAAVIRRVHALLESGFYQLPAGVPVNMGQPLIVRSPGGAVHSWMVPFLAGTRLVAWAQLSPALDPLRFSLLAGGNLTALPEAADWLDAAQILARVAASAGPDVELSPPVLTFHRDPSRLVWMVESRGASPARRWYSAGGHLWEDTGEDDEVTGGPPR